MNIKDLEEYVLVTWPESQELMELDEFDENSSLDFSLDSGPCAYFVKKSWLLSLNL